MRKVSYTTEKGIITNYAEANAIGIQSINLDVIKENPVIPDKREERKNNIAMGLTF